MNPTLHTFDTPVTIPRYDTAAKCICFLGLAEVDGALVLEWRPLHNWPRMRHRTTGQHAWLVKSLTDDIRRLPRSGEIALTFEELLVVDHFPIREWNVEEWLPIAD
jgi:hypothetical protein